MIRPVPVFFFLLAARLLLLPVALQAQDEPTYAEKPGWPAGSRVVILHIDYAGMSYESNLGAIRALEKGVATSVSVMMPCPWGPGFVRYFKEHPRVDAGLPVPDDLHNGTHGWDLPAGAACTPGRRKSSRTERYTGAPRTRQPGVTMIVTHGARRNPQAHLRLGGQPGGRPAGNARPGPAGGHPRRKDHPHHAART